MGNSSLPCCAHNIPSRSNEEDFVKVTADTQERPNGTPDPKIEVPEQFPSVANKENEAPTKQEEANNVLKTEEPPKSPAAEQLRKMAEEDAAEPAKQVQAQAQPPPAAAPPPNPVAEAPKGPELKMMDQMWQKYQEGTMVQKEKDFLADKSGGIARRPSTESIGFHDYSEKHSSIFQQLKALVASDGWELKKTHETVEIFTKSVAGQSNLATKGKTTMKTFGNGIRHLVAHMLTAEDRAKYDEICDSGRTIESYLPYYRTLYFQIKSPAAIIAPRDVCTISRLQFEKDGSLLIATASFDHPNVPEKPPHVRTKVLGGYIINPTNDPDVYEVTFCISADPQGWLPQWVKNLVAWKSQLVLAHFKNYYTKEFGKK